MEKLVKTSESLATLVDLWSGKNCPHEKECACRAGNWCPKAKSKLPDEKSDYPILHLAGCSLGYAHCCCRILDEVEILANEYLKRAGIDEPPVPIDIINLFDAHRPIEIRPLSLKAYLGCTWFLGDEWVIHLNANEAPFVNRFTAFHEGFHILCGNRGIAFKQAGERYKPLSERLADYFAASILMPKSLIFEVWPTVTSVGAMARIFGVPRPVMKKWLTRLGVFTAQVSI